MCNVNDLTEIPDDLDTPPDSDSEQNQQQLNQPPQLQIQPTPAPNKPVQKKLKVLPPSEKEIEFKVPARGLGSDLLGFDKMASRIKIRDDDESSNK